MVSVFASLSHRRHGAGASDQDVVSDGKCGWTSWMDQAGTDVALVDAA